MGLERVTLTQAHAHIVKSLPITKIDSLIEENNQKIAQIEQECPDNNKVLSLREQQQVYEEVIGFVNEYLNLPRNKVPRLETRERYLFERAMPITSTISMITGTLALLDKLSVLNALSMSGIALCNSYLYQYHQIRNTLAHFNSTKNVITIPGKLDDDIAHGVLGHEYTHSKQPTSKYSGILKIINWEIWLSEAHAYGVQKQVVQHFAKKLRRPRITLDYMLDQQDYLNCLKMDIEAKRNVSTEANFENGFEEHKIGFLASVLLEKKYGASVFRDMLIKRKLDYTI